MIMKFFIKIIIKLIKILVYIPMLIYSTQFNCDFNEIIEKEISDK